MILVTGATGNIGNRVVGMLAARGERCRAFVRDIAKAAQVRAATVGVVAGDFADPASVRAALDGVDAVLLCSGNDPHQVDHERNVIDAVATTNRCPIVKISSVGARPGSPAAFVDWHGRSEANLAASGVPATVLRAGFLMSNLLAAAAPIRDGGPLAAPAGDARIAMVDPDDIAACAVVALTERGHLGRAYEVTGPEALAYAQAADTPLGVLGRPVPFVDTPPGGCPRGSARVGDARWFADGFLTLFAELRHGIAAKVTTGVAELTGRPARSLGDFLHAHRSAFDACDRAIGLTAGGPAAPSPRRSTRATSPPTTHGTAPTGTSGPRTPTPSMTASPDYRQAFLDATQPRAADRVSTSAAETARAPSTPPDSPAEGTVLGVDLSEPMLPWPADRAADQRVTNVDVPANRRPGAPVRARVLRRRHQPHRRHVLLRSVAAFTNVARSLRSAKRRLTLLAWQAYGDNEWIGELSRIVGARAASIDTVTRRTRALLAGRPRRGPATCSKRSGYTVHRRRRPLPDPCTSGPR